MQAKLDIWFQYHKPTEDQLPKYEELRAAARAFAEVVVRLTPEGPDQMAAVRKIREAAMTANQSIACGRI